MGLIGTFNGLHKQVKTRKELQAIITEAYAQEQPSVAKRLEAILAANPKEKRFRLQIQKPAIEVVPESFISCLDCENDQDDKIAGLGKAVSPDQIYQMITDKMIRLIKDANAKDWKQPWEAKFYGKGYTTPFNFVTKKSYRGVNRFLLTGFKPLENPFYLTFKQIEDLGGKLRKGSKGLEVVYFTKLYLYYDAKSKIDLSSYDRTKFSEMLADNSLHWIDPSDHELPILKYYKVFNGKDIDGINWDLENFKHGFIEKELPADDENRMPVAEAIIKHYPTPAPTYTFGGDAAFYRSTKDTVNMPYLPDFDTAQDYYKTFFHELAHSTGHNSRLSRKFGTSFGIKEYAFEELIAEFGATFLSAESGIIWHTSKNTPAYLKGWNAALTHMKDDNRFLMRAATQAQKVADFVLQYDAKGNPAYFADIVKVIKPKRKTKKAVKKTVAPPAKKDKKARLENINPPSYNRRPKSVSVATAVADVLATGKYSVKPMQATVLYTVLKDVEDISADDIKIKTSKFQKGILNGIPDRLLWFYDYDDTITLSDRGVTFVNAIRGRMESLKNQKTSYALFDGLKGAQAEAVDTVEEIEPVIQPVAEVEPPVMHVPAVMPERKRNPLVKRIGEKSTEGPAQYFTVAGEVGKFLQRVERKPIQSVVITMDGERGAGKTTTLYKFMDAFATPGNSCLYLSLEEHPESDLATEKENKYLSAAARQNIDTVAEVDNAPQLYELIADYDIIFIDSWQKLVRMVGNIKLDEDLRKRFNGKVFVIIFQQTTTGSTKGGAEIGFDGDIIIKMVKEFRFADNYAYFDKHRYTLIPIENIRYNIATGTVYDPEASTEPEAESIEIPKHSSELKFKVV